MRSGARGTKGEVLARLGPLLKTCMVEPLVLFSVREWRKDRARVLARIRALPAERLIARSSARGEDTHESSNAGRFTSVLEVPASDPARVAAAVERVIGSFGPRCDGDQVLVQTQTSGVALSGVVFTRVLGTNAPYYEISYDESGDTTAVTSGRRGTKLLIARFWKGALPSPWGKVLRAVREVESRSDPRLPLDIEFAVRADGTVVLFQVRPLAANKDAPRPDDARFQAVVESYRERFARYNRRLPHLAGPRTLFGDMPDWNPAEMLGAHPYTLAYSLYRHLITDEIWHRARTRMGYYDVSPAHLMVTFGRKPYIDVRLSFNSLTPAALAPGLRDRLVAFYLDKLAASPALQDKVEFDVVWTGCDLSTRKALEGLPRRFSAADRRAILASLRGLTNGIFGRFGTLAAEADAAAETMRRRREDVLASARGKLSPWDLVTHAYILLDHARHYGTLPFSILARATFLSRAFLRSAVAEGLITQADSDAFLKSKPTVATEFARDSGLLSAGRLGEAEFLRRYGHLRPGTYDITAPRYDQMPRHLHGAGAGAPARSTPFSFPAKTLARLQARMKAEGLAGRATDVLDIVLESAARREALKFEFTKNLSEALELIARAGELLGLSREELQFLHYNDLLKFRNPADADPAAAARSLRRQIESRRRQRAVYDRIPLPDLVAEAEDFCLIRQHQARPNFITSKRAKGPAAYVSASGAARRDLAGRIVLIESADPGYDWIFSRGIKGLVTQYGGAASHMAIRCAEFGLPAAIGVGSALFAELKRHPYLVLDCDNAQLFPVA